MCTRFKSRKNKRNAHTWAPGLSRAWTTCAAAFAAQMASARRPVAGRSLMPHTSVCPATAIRPSICAPRELCREGSGEVRGGSSEAWEKKSDVHGNDRGSAVLLCQGQRTHILTTSPDSSLWSEWGAGRKFCTQLLMQIVVGKAGPRSLSSGSSI
jgi:hypothetical protein